MDQPTFAAPAGTCHGWRDGDVIRATGIRYARAERYGLPSPEPDTKRIDATSWAPACTQEQSERERELIGPMLDQLGFAEDCQRLSITMPAQGAEGLPVMVWIHGGSYISGAGDAPVYDPTPLVTEQQVVAVNVTFDSGASAGWAGQTAHQPIWGSSTSRRRCAGSGATSQPSVVIPTTSRCSASPPAQTRSPT